MRRIITATLGLALGLTTAAHAGPRFDVTNLVTNNQAANPAKITDPNLRNPWGIASSPTGPFWISDNATGVSTLYAVNPTTNATTKNPLTVSIPGDGSVTGQVFNADGAAFGGNRFIFVSEDGTVSGWKAGTAATVLALGSSSNVYKGVAEGSTGGFSYLYSANFRAGTIDVMKGVAAAPTLAGTFTDPGLPAGYAPFNIQNLGGKLYVTYALQDPSKHDDVAGAGHGFVDVFDLSGNFLGRVGSGGTLDSPWGLAIAPTSFGSLAGDLLVGNFGDGRINAFNLGTNTFDGQLLGRDGNPIEIDGLWAITVGNNGSSGSKQSLYFTAGPNGESDGLFGVLTVVPEPSTVASACVAGIVGVVVARSRRRRS